jgi:hypothetical protein
MNKKEIIRKYGRGTYKKMLEQARRWKLENPERVQDGSRKQNKEHSRKGGKYYLKKQRYNSTGIQGERHRIRIKHANKWRLFKRIVAPATQIHHEWVSGTSRYRGVALVEKNAHQYGIIDVIKILDGKITLLVEEK